MGNQCIAIKRHRVRTVDNKQEMPIPSYEAFVSTDQLLDVALNRMLYGLSSRDHKCGIEDCGDIAEASGISKSPKSRRLI